MVCIKDLIAVKFSVEEFGLVGLKKKTFALIPVISHRESPGATRVTVQSVAKL